MKRLILIFTFLFAVSSSFTGCRDNERGSEEVDIMEEDRGTEDFEGQGAMDGGFGTYDTNRDNQLDEDEFGESYQEDFAGYDADTSGDLNDQEFSQATFRSADRDRDNSLNREEWDSGYRTTFGDYTNDEDFDRIDRDRSGTLSDAEWNQGFEESDMFGTYDADRNNSVSQQEWTRTNFSRWDRNGDGVLDQQEFQAYNQAMMGSNDMGNNNPNSQNNNSQQGNQ